MARTGIVAARTVLVTLVLIHFILPFTPINTHPQFRIVVGSLVIGTSFLLLLGMSFRVPGKAFATAIVLLAGVYVVSALTGASPFAEGLVIKVLFLAVLVRGLIAVRT